jgi:hypothetical protein
METERRDVIKIKLYPQKSGDFSIERNGHWDGTLVRGADGSYSFDIVITEVWATDYDFLGNHVEIVPELPEVVWT